MIASGGGGHAGTGTLSGITFVRIEIVSTISFLSTHPSCYRPQNRLFLLRSSAAKPPTTSRQAEDPCSA
jgi:hypothetical protein